MLSSMQISFSFVIEFLHLEFSIPFKNKYLWHYVAFLNLAYTSLEIYVGI